MRANVSCGMLRKQASANEDFHFPDGLPTADYLTCSDDKPVDKDWSWRSTPAKKVRNELQTLITKSC
jgi:predicted HAD superfamily Cof-like phosphohydrolase